MVLPPRAYVFISLNAVRVLSIIALLLIFSSNILIMVEDIKAVKAGSTSLTTAGANGQMETYDCDYYDNSTVPNQPAGVFWAIINRLFIIATTILMILSEIGWPNKFFQTYLPVLGPDFGVGILGGIQWITAASILSHHVDDFPLVAGFFLFVIGCFNILLGLIFRSSIKDKRSILTFRETKANDLLPSPISSRTKDIKVLQLSAGSIFDGGKNMYNDKFSEKSGSGFLARKDSDGSFGHHSSNSNSNGFGRQGEKNAAFNGYFVTKPGNSLPRYHAQPPKTTVEDDHEDNREYERGPRHEKHFSDDTMHSGRI